MINLAEIVRSELRRIESEEGVELSTQLREILQRRLTREMAEALYTAIHLPGHEAHQAIEKGREVA